METQNDLFNHVFFENTLFLLMSREGQIFYLSPCPLSSRQSFKHLFVVNPNISGQSAVRVSELLKDF